ncbi:MAG: hypothetical protein ACKOA8_15520, partial [Deltaproteobacteria bacterium]
RWPHIIMVEEKRCQSPLKLENELRRKGVSHLLELRRNGEEKRCQSPLKLDGRLTLIKDTS